MRTIKDKVWEIGSMLSSVCYAIEEMEIDVGESELVDRIYDTLRSLERECDAIVDEAIDDYATSLHTGIGGAA